MKAKAETTAKTFLDAKIGFIFKTLIIEAINNRRQQTWLECDTERHRLGFSTQSLALDQYAGVKHMVQSDHHKKINVFKVVLISRTAVVIRNALIIEHTQRFTQN